MNTTNEALAFALRKAWLANADPMAVFSDETGQRLTDYLIDTEPSAQLPSFYDRQILQKLAIGPVSPSLGQYLTERLARVAPGLQTEQTGFAPDTLTALCDDRFKPMSVPLMRMKRLVEYLGLTIDDAVDAIRETAHRYQQLNHQSPAVAYSGSYGRMPAPSRDIAPLSYGNGENSHADDEALTVYLERLSDLLATNQPAN
jgi:hypothetical protein